MEDKNAGSTAVAEATENPTTPAKKPAKSSKAKKASRAKSSHPPTSEMVTAAIKELKDRKGSSLQAIKKYIVATYKVDGEKVAPFIRRYLKSAVTSGAVVQTKGKGASGSFKLSGGKAPEAKPRSERIAKAAEPKKVKVEKKTTVSKKPAATKKPVAKKAAEVAKKAAGKKKVPAKSPEKVKAATEAKNLSKSKKSAKAPAAKTRTPKPKKAMAAKAGKAAAKK